MRHGSPSFRATFSAASCAERGRSRGGSRGGVRARGRAKVGREGGDPEVGRTWRRRSPKVLRLAGGGEAKKENFKEFF